MVIRFDPLRSVVKLTLPIRVSVSEGMAFVESRKRWLERCIAAHPQTTTLADGAEFPMLGTLYLAVHMPGRGVVSVHGSTVRVHGDVEHFNRRLKDWLKKRLLHEIQIIAQQKEALLPPHPRKGGVKKIQIRETTSHWGSCSHRGNLSFSWRMIFAPYEVLEYLVAHEMAHLREMNHGPRFWNLVGELCPNYLQYRDWLKKHGNELYRYC